MSGTSEGKYFVKKSYVPKILSGHIDEISCVVADSDLDICISGSNDGCILIHNLNDESYVRRLYYPNRKRVDKLLICPFGYFFAYSKDDMYIRKYNVNGVLLQSDFCEDVFNEICFSPCYKYLISGGEKGVISIRTTEELILEKNILLKGIVRTLYITEKIIYVGIDKDIVIIKDVL